LWLDCSYNCADLKPNNVLNQLSNQAVPFPREFVVALISEEMPHESITFGESKDFPPGEKRGKISLEMSGEERLESIDFV
jgi:hypothetical protein